MSLTLSFALEALLCLLLLVTLIYCVILERRLSNVQKGQQLLGRTVRELNVAIHNAGAALTELKSTSGQALADLEKRARAARALADELAVMTASGERIAERIDQGVSSRRADAPDAPDAPLGRENREEGEGYDPEGYRTRPRAGGETLMERLDALRTVR